MSYRAVDFSYVDERVAIEYESYEHHTGKLALERDSARGNQCSSSAGCLAPPGRPASRRPPALRRDPPRLERPADGFGVATRLSGLATPKRKGSGEELGDQVEEGGAVGGGRRVTDEHRGPGPGGFGGTRHLRHRSGIPTHDDCEWQRVGAHSSGCIFEYEPL